MDSETSLEATFQACFIGKRNKDSRKTPLNRELTWQKALDIQNLTFTQMANNVLLIVVDASNYPEPCSTLQELDRLREEISEELDAFSARGALTDYTTSSLGWGLS